MWIIGVEHYISLATDCTKLHGAEANIVASSHDYMVQIRLISEAVLCLSISRSANTVANTYLALIKP